MYSMPGTGLTVRTPFVPTDLGLNEYTSGETGARFEFEFEDGSNHSVECTASRSSSTVSLRVQ